MATFTNYQDTLKICPYNSNHRVSARRFQQHLVSCEKSGLYKDKNLVQCPYNATHRIPADKLNEHVLTCKDNRSVIREMTTERTVKAGKSSVTENEKKPNRPLEEEDWDDPNNLTGKNYIIPGLAHSSSPKREHQDDAESISNESASKKLFKIKSAIELQRMTPSERKKYYQELNEEAKKRQRESAERQSNETEVKFSNENPRENHHVQTLNDKDREFLESFQQEKASPPQTNVRPSQSSQDSAVHVKQERNEEDQVWLRDFTHSQRSTRPKTVEPALQTSQTFRPPRTQVPLANVKPVAKRERIPLIDDDDDDGDDDEFVQVDTPSNSRSGGEYSGTRSDDSFRIPFLD